MSKVIGLFVFAVICILAAARPAAANYVGVSPCDGLVRILAITNGTPIALTAVVESGACAATIYCDNGFGAQDPGTAFVILFRGTIAAFACPATSAGISFVPGIVAGGVVKIKTSN